MRRWNGVRCVVPNEYLERFADYLIQKKIKENKENNNSNSYTNNKNKNNYVPYYEWIEKLLQTPIHECRKLTLWRILCPYLVNIRKLSYEESFQILKEWLDKCNSESGKQLDFNPNQKIKDELKYVKNYFLLGVQKIKTDNEYTDLYQILKERKVLS